MKVDYSLWQPQLKAVGSLRAEVGVNVTTELAGMVQTIYFTPGAEVEKGQMLVQLNASAEIGLLHSLEARWNWQKLPSNVTRHNLKQTRSPSRWWILMNGHLKINKPELKNKKQPWKKRPYERLLLDELGINNINVGQYLNVGDTVTNLQALNPIYADFYMPQQALAQVKSESNGFTGCRHLS